MSLPKSVHFSSGGFHAYSPLQSNISSLCLEPIMFSSITGSSLTTSSQIIEATWENALSHFRRALLECGSPLNIEHSQRLGLLFSKRVGDSEELKKWTSFFDAEDVPTTALILQALVAHNQWRTAIQLLELNKDAAPTKELSEVLAQNLARIGRWQETLALAALLAPPRESESSQRSTKLAQFSASLSADKKNDDTYQMATNPAFVPDEERISYCGFVAAVAQGFPLRQDWERAIHVLCDLERVADSATQGKLFEYRIARCVHGGQKYDEVVEWSRKDLRFRTSPSLLRSLLHCTLALENSSMSIQVLEMLSLFGSSAVSVKMCEQVCTLFIAAFNEPNKDDLLRFQSASCTLADCIRTPHVQKLVAAFCADYDLKIPIFVSSNKSASLLEGKVPATAVTRSVTQLDRVATALLAQSRWKEALQMAEEIAREPARSDNEEIIISMLHSNSGSWEKTLQFFQA